jgi:hypothetical protein
MATGLGETRLRVSPRDLKAITTRLLRENQLMNQNMRGAVGRFSRKVRGTTSQNAPYRTGYMSRHVEIRYREDRLSSEVGWFRDTFARDHAQTRGRFYAHYQELIWNPSLGPAFNKHVGAFKKEVQQILLRAGTRRGSR